MRLRVEVDSRSERMNAKIRDAQLRKIPYMLVVGDREAEAQAAALRVRGGRDLGAMRWPKSWRSCARNVTPGPFAP